MQTNDFGRTANDAVAQSKTFIGNQVDAQTTQLGKRLSSTADGLRRIADDLRENETVPGGADVVGRGADAIDHAGRYFQDVDSDALLADIEHFARQRPWTVALAALAGGFVAARTLKAASARRYRDYREYNAAGYTRDYLNAR